MALHERVAAVLRQAIASGRYEVGAKLPTHRVIAQEHGVAIGTVTRAIDQLAEEGLVRGEVGRGTFVLPRTEEPVEGPIDLAINFPPPLIGEADFQKAAALAVRKGLTIPNAGYGDIRGTAEQRVILARWLKPRVGDVSADDLMVCVGGQHAIHLAFADLKDRTVGVASEAATFSGALVAAADLDMPVHAVPHDSKGMIPEALDRTLRQTGCRAVYTVPVCQNPLGYEVPLERRREILDVCVERDAWLIEDDIYGVYASTGSATLKLMDSERTWYLTSTSKCLSPLLRVGVLLPPRQRYAAVLQRLRAEVWGAAPVSIELACALIEAGVADRVAQDLVEEAKARVRLAADMLQLQPPMPNGAAHVWLPMEPTAAERLVRRAAEAGVRLTPPDANAVSNPAAGVRLCVMAPSRRSDLVRALRIVSDLRAPSVDPIV